MRASTKLMGTVAKTSGCLFRSWRNRHASGLVPLTESDGSRANDFYTTADSKVYDEGHRKLDVCTLDGQQRRAATFQVAIVKKALDQ